VGKATAEVSRVVLHLVLADGRQSKTLPQAVSEYKRRYGRPPPKGFEQWWKFARRNSIKIVDDMSGWYPHNVYIADT
jgi:hypothetical protein